MATVIVGSIVFGAYVLVSYHMYKQKKKGITNCSGCSGCSHTECQHHKD